MNKKPTYVYKDQTILSADARSAWQRLSTEQKHRHLAWILGVSSSDASAILTYIANGGNLPPQEDD